MRGLYVLIGSSLALSAILVSCASITGLSGLSVGCLDACDGSVIGDGRSADALSMESGAEAAPGTPDGGPLPDGAPSGPYIACGSATCSGGQVCCLRRGSGPPPSCAGSCNPVKDTEVACDTPDDCPAQVCCASTAPDGGVSKVACAASCAGFILCDPAAASLCPTTAPSCIASRLTGYHECGM